MKKITKLKSISGENLTIPVMYLILMNIYN